MSPTFEEIVNWLKTLEESQQVQPAPAPMPRRRLQAAVASAPPVEELAAVAPAPEKPPEHLANPGRSLLPHLSADHLVQGIIFSEVLGRPLSRRPRTRRF